MSQQAAASRYQCGYVLTFSDGGDPETQLLHEGSFEECERVGQVCLAVSYSGDRPLAAAHFVIVPAGGEISEKGA